MFFSWFENQGKSLASFCSEMNGNQDCPECSTLCNVQLYWAVRYCSKYDVLFEWN